MEAIEFLSDYKNLEEAFEISLGNIGVELEIIKSRI
jgi:hypothetical protein